MAWIKKKVRKSSNKEQTSPVFQSLPFPQLSVDGVEKEVVLNAEEINKQEINKNGKKLNKKAKSQDKEEIAQDVKKLNKKLKSKEEKLNKNNLKSQNTSDPAFEKDLKNDPFAKNDNSFRRPAHRFLRLRPSDPNEFCLRKNFNDEDLFLKQNNFNESVKSNVYVPPNSLSIYDTSPLRDSLYETVDDTYDDYTTIIYEPGDSGCVFTAPSPPPVPTSPRDPIASRRTSSSASRPPGGQSGGNEAWKYEKIYDTASVVKMEGFNSPFNQQERDIALDPNRLTLEKELGQGNFGSVMKGEYKLNNGRTIPVAVKTLKDEDIPNQRCEILKEADIMGKLDHPNIVRLIGVTQSPGFKIVMELAPQGPLHKYLKRQKDAPKLNILDILVLMLQVDEGMDYLEKQHFVHRDLAARNVLVVSENFVKISDFGMSRAMGAGNEYYRAERAGKWPLKWYAPECIYFRKFTSKSDIWSYGITMWEAVSYGEKPYRGIKGNELVQMLDDGHRLPQPHNCPDDIYKLTKSCWEYKDADRPTFAELGILLSQFIEKNRKKTKR